MSAKIYMIRWIFLAIVEHVLLCVDGCSVGGDSGVISGLHPRDPGHNPWSPHSWPQQVGEAATRQQKTLETTLKTTPETTRWSMTSSSLPPEPLPCLTPVVRGAPSISPKVVFWQGQYITLPQLYAVRRRNKV